MAGRATNNRTYTTPTTGSYGKLIHRFYETLVLLEALGRARGPRDINPGRASTPQERRRRLLCNLSHLCDFEKGGRTTAAIGLEERPDLFTFWVASNANDTSEKVKTHLSAILTEAKRIVPLSGEGRALCEDRFTRSCIEFTRPRLYKEVSMLSSKIRDCEKYLDLEGNAEDLALWDWLQGFVRERDYVNTCFLAYEQRRATEMRYLKMKFETALEEQAPLDVSSAFDRIRHCIGRLASHVRAPKQVIEDVSVLGRFFDFYNIRQIPPMSSVERPRPNGRTTLYGIVKRMLSGYDQNLLPEYEKTLPIMDHKLSLEQRIKNVYASENFQPKVHAEVQVLEHFYENRLQFADGDRYIGCSKPACFCCRLYFRHHPLFVVEPVTHHNVYLNWGPPGLPTGDRDPRFQHQRDILNDMLVTIRQEALEQLRNRAGPLDRHPDSHTGITPSLTSEPHEPGNQSSLTTTTTTRSMESEFASLSIGSTDSSASRNEGNRPSSPVYSSTSVLAAESSSLESGGLSEDDGSDAEGGASLL